MSQILASSRMPVPNVLPGFIGDHGTLFIRTGNTWHVWTGLEWQPEKVGYTARELWRAHKCRPPMNVDDGWAGVCHNGPFPLNWTKKDLRAAMRIFLQAHQHEYAPVDGQCWDPLKKGRMLARQRDQRAVDLQRRTEQAGLIRVAAPDLEHANV